MTDPMISGSFSRSASRPERPPRLVEWSDMIDDGWKSGAASSPLTPPGKARSMSAVL
jgi:hypothetical protein